MPPYRTEDLGRLRRLERMQTWMRYQGFPSLLMACSGQRRGLISTSVYIIFDHRSHRGATEGTVEGFVEKPYKSRRMAIQMPAVGDSVRARYYICKPYVVYTIIRLICLIHIIHGLIYLRYTALLRRVRRGVSSYACICGVRQRNVLWKEIKESAVGRTGWRTRYFCLLFLL
ncbi:hypothetical protein F5Y11DRAFT_339421 [Daldinia sp. FL1419]|nr:hypothetical protein F5Y11DRAFT_339421 [Daldinia sp. FL1419]